MSLGSGSAAAAPLEIDDDGGNTPLATLNHRFGRVLRPGECQISPEPGEAQPGQVTRPAVSGSGPGAGAVRQAREPALLPDQVPDRGARRAPRSGAVLQSCRHIDCGVIGRSESFIGERSADALLASGERMPEAWRLRMASLASSRVRPQVLSMPVASMNTIRVKALLPRDVIGAAVILDAVTASISREEQPSR